MSACAHHHQGRPTQLLITTIQGIKTLPGHKIAEWNGHYTAPSRKQTIREALLVKIIVAMKSAPLQIFERGDSHCFRSAQNYPDWKLSLRHELNPWGLPVNMKPKLKLNLILNGIYSPSKNFATSEKWFLDFEYFWEKCSDTYNFDPILTKLGRNMVRGCR